MSTHRYNTRFQAALKKEATTYVLPVSELTSLMFSTKPADIKDSECRIIQARLDACNRSPPAVKSFTIFEKVCNVFDDLTTMNLWKTNPRFNTVVRNKMAEFRDQVHLIHAHDGRVVGVMIDKVTVIYDEMYLYPVKQMFSVMDRLEKAMNEHDQKQ
jgi:hypothetical protein